MAAGPSGQHTEGASGSKGAPARKRRLFCQEAHSQRRKLRLRPLRRLASRASAVCHGRRPNRLFVLGYGVLPAHIRDVVPDNIGGMAWHVERWLRTDLDQTYRVGISGCPHSLTTRGLRGHGLHQAATALATAAIAPMMAAHATIRARIFSSRPKLRPAVSAVNELREETKSSSCQPASNSESAFPSCCQLSLSRINAPSRCSVPNEPTRCIASAQSPPGSWIRISCIGATSCSPCGVSRAMASQRSLTAAGSRRS